MVLNKGVNYLNELPFSATYSTETMKVSFNRGYIFNCYNSFTNDNARLGEGSNYFSQGPFFYESGNEEYEFQFNDFFYIDETGNIFKLTKTQREDYDYMYVRFNTNFPSYLIWKAPSSKLAAGEQIISENIFLQDASLNTQGFASKAIKINEDESSNSELYGGFVIVQGGNYQEFLEGFSYTTRSGENEHSYGIKMNVTASVANPLIEDDEPYIKDFNVTSASLIRFTGEEEDEMASIYNETGVYYFPIILASVTLFGNFYIDFDFNLYTETPYSRKVLNVRSYGFR